MTEFDDQGYIEYIVKGMVDHPEDVKVTRTVDELGVLLEVHANPEDMGTIIGRAGQNAKALRTILRVVGAKHDARLNLRIAEPGGGHRATRDEQPQAADETKPEETPITTEADTSVTANSSDVQPLEDDVPTDLLA